MYSLSDESHTYPLSNYNQSPSFLSIQESSNINTFFPQQQHHHQNLLHGPFNHLSPLLNPPIYEYPINNLTTNLLLEEAPNEQENPMNFPSNMSNNEVSSNKRGAPAGRKDRHTKISTAQGLRDRRVRLSISIARDFFSLQDMLGFDKASKTLGWLMAKCKVAIDEVSCTSKINSELQVVAQGTNKEKKVQEEEKRGLLNGKYSKKKRGRRSENNVCKGDEEVASREVMRAKARERARERTKNKKKKMMSIDHNSNNQVEQHNLMICQPSSKAAQHTTSSYGRGEFGGISKNKFRGSSHIYNHEMSSKTYDESSTSNYYNDYITRLALEGHNGGIIRPSGFSTLNIINLSTAIHINAKPWETSGNQILQ